LEQVLYLLRLRILFQPLLFLTEAG
jgi:hypothetical protein